MGRVFLIIGISLVGLYLLVVLVDVIFVLSFSSIMKKHDNAIRILIRSRIDTLNKIKMALVKKGLPLENDPQTDVTSLSLKRSLAFENEEFVSIKNALSLAEAKILSYVTPDMEDENLITLKGDLDQLNTAYRSNVIMYNADVLGYNYWIKFLPTRYIYLIFRKKEKGLIS